MIINVLHLPREYDYFLGKKSSLITNKNIQCFIALQLYYENSTYKFFIMMMNSRKGSIKK